MSAPAGWYPDPADPTRTRWWDGSRWSEHTSPATGAAPAAQTRPEVPRYGEYAPAQPAAAPPAAPAWPAAAPAVRLGPSAAGADTNTVWIYLCILVSTLPVLTIFFIDWNSYFETMLSVDSGDAAASAAATSAMMQWIGGILAISLLSYVFIGLSILFAWLDWRELRRRGVERPFHWAFAFLALVISIGVYIIGRTVVLKRETGSGLTALWVWIATIVLSFVIGMVWFAVVWQQIITLVPAA